VKESPESSAETVRDLEAALVHDLPQALRGRVRPVDVAKRLAQEMEGRSAETPTGLHAPNEFAVVLSPEDLEQLQPFQASLAGQFAEFLRSLAGARGLRLPGPVSAGFESDEALQPGEFQVESRAARPGSEQPSFEDLTEQDAVPQAFIHVLSGVDGGASLSISSPSVSIGRGLLCDLRLSDPEAARRHARISAEGGAFVIHDLGSPSGTFVGSDRVESRALEDGDVIRIGATTLKFSLRS
jgi:hypothetical protein